MSTKLVTTVVATIAVVVAVFFLLRPTPPSPGTPDQPQTPAVPKSVAPSMPFNPAEFKPGVGVSERSIERLVTRVEELQATSAQLAVKMKSIEERLADPAEAANAAALREAKQALERSTQQMELEEKALADFLRNERERPATGP
jgi:hypothetical protein